MDFLFNIVKYVDMPLTSVAYYQQYPEVMEVVEREITQERCKEINEMFLAAKELHSTIHQLEKDIRDARRKKHHRIEENLYKQIEDLKNSFYDKYDHNNYDYVYDKYNKTSFVPVIKMGMFP